MQRLLTGVDEAGRSCVVSRDAPDLIPGAPGVTVDLLMETSGSAAPPVPHRQAEFLDLGLGTDVMRWTVLEFEPGASFSMHYTETIDVDTILVGSMDLILDDGVHPLSAGDCVAMAGVDHAWRAGPDGCQMSVVSLGTSPPTP